MAGSVCPSMLAPQLMKYTERAQTQNEFFLSLSRLVAHNLFVSTWLFKIDDEVNGRGHASLSLEGVKSIVELRKKKMEITESVIEKICEVIKKVVPKKTKIA